MIYTHTDEVDIILSMRSIFVIQNEERKLLKNNYITKCRKSDWIW